jgi:type II secretory pathway predicted ATPase ExeA
MGHLVSEGGFALVTGDPGCGKSSAMRLVQSKMSTMRDATVGVLEHPQSRLSDFYRELGDIFGVCLSPNNRWGGFKALREKWQTHMVSTTWRPVLLVDEAQEMNDAVLNELRILSTGKFDSANLLTVCLAGDARLLDKLTTQELLPLAGRIKVRLNLGYCTPVQLLAYLTHALQHAGNPALMTEQLSKTLCERAVGNLRVLNNTANQLLVEAVHRKMPQLDEQLYLQMFDTTQQRKPQPARRAS